jgi:hypothetical protein
MKTTLKFYIGERSNPQLKKPYYVSYGQLTKKDAKKKEDCLYGSMSLTSYETDEEYNSAISKLETEGFKVNKY